jgi:hypothetical protein
VLFRFTTRQRAGVCAALLALCGALVPAPAAASPTFPFPWPDYSVVPVLFVPTDWSTGSAEVQAEAAAITTAMAEIQAFYRNNFDGRTFRLNGLNVVQANGAKEAYDIRWTGGNIYTDGVALGPAFEGRVVQELFNRGYPTPPGQNQSGYSTLIFVKGAGGYAGGRAYSGFDGGHAILGDWAIDSLDGGVAEGAYWWSGRRLQTGASAHELGHTFGLDHPDSYGGSNASSVMGNWWDFPTVGLNSTDRTRLSTNKGPWFPGSGSTVPAAPSGPSATALNGTQIRVGWVDNSGNETSFQIYNGVSTVTVGANSTGYTWGGLAQGTYMCFTVRAVNAAGASAWTPYACTTTPTVPAAPTRQSAAALNASQIRVGWVDNSGNETGFQIYDGVGFFSVGPNATTFTRGGLASRTYMCFAIRSFNAAGYSAWTPYACTTTL